MKKTIPELDKLFQEIVSYRSTAEFEKLLKFVKKFPKIAPYNAMLLHIQKPGSVYVASARDWLYKFSRRIKLKARPMVILHTFGPVSFVYDLSDTYGDKPFPKELLNPFSVKGEISQFEFQLLIRNMKCDGILYCEADFGTNMAGCVRCSYTGNEMTVLTSTKEIKVRVLYDMAVNKNNKIETRFTTVLHELGHLYCGHLGMPSINRNTLFNWWNDRKSLGINEQEFEAECVCWMICERRGIENPSAKYLSGYLNHNNEIPEISIDAVLKAVAKIEGLFDNNKRKEPRKEIINQIIDLKYKRSV